jgi:excisionase family DNA binding protein
LPIRATDEKQLLTVADLAKLLHQKPPAVRLKAKRGEIGFHRVGKAMLFSSADVEAYLARAYRPATPTRS